MNARVKGSLAALALTAIAGVVSWVIAGLADFDPNVQPIGYVAQPAVSSHILYTGAVDANRTRIYVIDYDATDWSGNLHSYPLSNVGAVVKTDDWTAGSDGAAGAIDIQDPTSKTAAPTGRNIVTRDGSTNITFRWDQLSSAQKSALDPATAKDAKAKSSKVLDYVRGHRDNEGTKAGEYRVRTSALGDIIHSTPVYCPATAPTPAAACTAATVFVGANDGMLHAINAATGSERFAYIPSSLIPRLANLVVSPLTHQYYVDGRMDIRKFGNITILAGALGAGGKGLYALNVTNAAATSEADAATKILWEVTNATANYANLGYTYGQPVLTTLVGDVDALVVGNGYNNSANGQASLFLIDPANGNRRQELLTNTGSLASRNGLSSPTLVADSTGRAAYAYAGDLEGNLWKFKLFGDYAVSKLFAVPSGQSITMAPGVVEHPKGGYMVTFVTGRMLLPDDETDNSIHHAYGIWDGAPGSLPIVSSELLEQELAEQTWVSGGTSIRVRTATNNVPNWTAGHHRGWHTPLTMNGERIVGDGAFVNGATFIFLTTNPTVTATPPVPSGENWWMQLNAITGGDNNAIRFDLDRSGTFNSTDQVTVSGVLKSPVGRNLGGGRRSQLTALDAGTFDVYQANYDKNALTPPTGDLGVSGGHFDYDIYYYNSAGTVTTVPTGTPVVGTAPACAKSGDVSNAKGTVTSTYCNTTGAAKNGYPANYGYMTSYTTGAACGANKAKTNLQTIYCSAYSNVTTAGTSYAKQLHVHEYDDIYDVTGVNMLAASDSNFNLSNVPALSSTSTPFKILVMNQYLNPAAKLAIGPSAGEVSVKDYGTLASQTDPAVLLGAVGSGGLATYTRANIGTFLFNLPKTAFQSKDWWGDGGAVRAGLIPTQTGCVNHPGVTGVSNQPGPQGERSNGALTIQIIKDTTPSSALELNVAGDVRYGWRVNAASFTTYVLAEYTTFWHHPNGECYGDAGWVANPPQDAASDSKAQAGDPGSADPKGVFGGPGGSTTGPTVTSTVNNPDGSTTYNYSDGTSVTIYPEPFDIGSDATGGSVDKRPVIAPSEATGRINWRELRK